MKAAAIRAVLSGSKGKLQGPETIPERRRHRHRVASLGIRIR